MIVDTVHEPLMGPFSDQLTVAVTAEAEPFVSNPLAATESPMAAVVGWTLPWMERNGVGVARGVGVAVAVAV